MNIVTSQCKTTLLLNNAWQPVTTITARAAFMHILKKRANALDKNQNIFSSMESWNSSAQFYEDQPVLRSVKNVWPIPTVIIVTSKFFRRPKKKKLSTEELAKICNNTCQYCFNRFALGDLTIDHIYPKSKGGTDDYSNRVLACRKCNSRKSSTTPFFDKNGNIPQPPSIPHIILGVKQNRSEWDVFLQAI